MWLVLKIQYLLLENREHIYIYISGFGGLVVSMLASRTQDRGFDPGRSRRIFRAKKSTAWIGVHFNVCNFTLFHSQLQSLSECGKWRNIQYPFNTNSTITSYYPFILNFPKMEFSRLWHRLTAKWVEIQFHKEKKNVQTQI